MHLFQRPCRSRRPGGVDVVEVQIGGPELTGVQRVQRGDESEQAVTRHELLAETGQRPAEHVTLAGQAQDEGLAVQHDG